MKYTIKNLTNSPYTVPGAKGPVHVPARGEASGDFDALQIAAIRGVGYFQVSEALAAGSVDAGHIKAGSVPISKLVQAEADGPEAIRAPEGGTIQPKRGPGRPKKAD